MILKPGMQKRQYLQWFWSLGCKTDSICNDCEAWWYKNDSIYNDFEAWDAKATVFTMILKPVMQQRQNLQWFRSLGCKSDSIYNDFEAWGCKNDSIYNDFEAWDAKATVFTMILKPGMQQRQYLQWVWSLGCKNDNIYNDSEAWDAKTTVFTMICFIN